MPLSDRCCVCVFAVQVTFIGSIIFAIAAGVTQGRAEKKLQKKDPDRFPPGLDVQFKEFYQKWKNKEVRGSTHTYTQRVPALPRTCSPLPLTAVLLCLCCCAGETVLDQDTTGDVAKGQGGEGQVGDCKGAPKDEDGCGVDGRWRREGRTRAAEGERALAVRGVK